MEEPAKPFACTLPECGMSFTNEDHLHVHTKKHDMVLQLGLEQKAAFVADQTPTPTRFIRNCEEVGLFQDLQNVNPFDEGFKRAMETKQGILSLESTLSGATDDVLHTPQMVFPLIDNPETTLYSATNNQRNITISRSSSDESGTIKEYETTTISKLTNEVTTISRIVGNRDVIDKIVNADEGNTAKSTDAATAKENNTNTNIINGKVYKNNIIKIHSNVEIRKDGVLNINNRKNAPVLIYADSVIKDSIKDVLLADNTKLQVEDKVPPIMSQKSLDFVVDSLATELNVNKTINAVKKDTDIDKVTKMKDFGEKTNKLTQDNNIVDITDDSNIKSENLEVKKPKDESKDTNEYEVIIKLPSGKEVKMKPVEDTAKTDTKEVIRKRLTSRKKQKVDNPLQNVLQIPTGTLIPVTIVNSIGVGVPITHKLPLPANPNKTNVPIPQTVIIRNGSSNLNVLPVVTSVNHTIKLPRANKRVLDEKQSTNNKTEKEIASQQRDDTQVPDTAKRKEILSDKHTETAKTNNVNNASNTTDNDNNIVTIDDDDDDEECLRNQKLFQAEEHKAKKSRFELESRSAASKRYRERLKETMRRQAEKNRRLEAENAALKLMITEHSKCCSNAFDLSVRLEKLRKIHYALDNKNK